MKIFETVWSRDFTDKQVLANKLKKKNWNLSSLYMLNYFKYFQIYILGHLSEKNQTKVLNYIKSSCVRMT